MKEIVYGTTDRKFVPNSLNLTSLHKWSLNYYNNLQTITFQQTLSEQDLCMRISFA